MTNEEAIANLEAAIRRLTEQDEKLNAITLAYLRAVLNHIKDPWQPIETAPRDSTPFIAFYSKNDTYEWAGTVRYEFPSDEFPEIGRHDGAFCGLEINPSGWMPLQEPKKKNNE